MKHIAPAVDESTPHGITATVARLITSGDRAPGGRLPGLRELALELEVSSATVSHARQALSSVGLIVSRHARDAVVIEDDHSGEFAIVCDLSLGSWLPVLDLANAAATLGDAGRGGYSRGSRPDLC